ncbi:MAG: pilus assembly protein PilM [bacterium]
MARNYITTVDIGTNSVKILQLGLTQNGLVVINSGIKKYPRQTASEKPSDDEIINTILQLNSEKGFNMRHVALSIPRHLITVKGFSGFPAAASDEDIYRMISVQLEPELPFPISESVYSIYNLQKGQDGISLEVVASRKTYIERYIDIAQKAGMKLRTIIPSAFATYGVVFDQLKELLIGNNVAILDIGAGETDFCIIQHGRLSFSRSFTHGGNNLTQLYEKEYGLTFDEAEERKIKEANLKAGLEDPLTLQWADMLRTQVIQSIRAFSGKETNGGINVLWLCGGSSLIPGLERFLSEKLNIDISFLPQFQGIERRLLAEEEVVEDTNITVNLGLGIISMAGAERTPTVNVNLLPKEILERSKRIRQRFLMAIAALVTVLVLTSAGIGFNSWYRSREALREALKSQIGKLEKDLVTEHAKEALGKSILMDYVMTPYVTPLEILREMSEKLPDRQKIALSNLNIDRTGKLTMGVEAVSHSDIGEVIRILSEIQVPDKGNLFSEVKHGAVSKITKDNKPILQMQIICTLNKETTQETEKNEKNNRT